MAHQPEQNATVIKTEGGIEWYALTSWRPNSFDITLTNGDGAWEAKGVTYPGGNISEDLWWTKAKQALQKPSAGTGITYSVRLLDGEGVRTSPAEVKWSWRHASGVLFKSQVSLQPAAAPAEAMRSVLGTCVASFHLLQAAVNDLSALCNQLRRELQQRQGEVVQARQEASARESDLYLKFSILLNRKKQLLRDAKADLDAANQALQDARSGADLQETTTRDSGGDEGVYSASTQQEDSAGSGPGMDVDSAVRGVEGTPATGRRSGRNPDVSSPAAHSPPAEVGAVDPMELPTQRIDAPLPVVPGRGTTAGAGQASSTSTASAPSGPRRSLASLIATAASPAPAAMSAPGPAAAAAAAIQAAAIQGSGSGAAAAATGATLPAGAVKQEGAALPGDNWELAELALAAGGESQPVPQPPAGGRARAKRPRR